MPDFFVWSVPSLIELIDAANEHEAAEAFLERSATSNPILGKPPACFVQATTGLELPRTDGSSVEFWVDTGKPPE